MGKDIKTKRRKTKMRSYRKARQILLAFGMAGLILGMALALVFLAKGNIFLVKVGVLYVLAAASLLGIRGVLTYLDDINKQRRSKNQTRRVQRT